ncbi:MAG: hypothetical protein WAW52_00865 [Methanothrix sp.]
MPVLSIVACRMLEDELVHLLSADREVRELLLVDGKEALSLSAKLRAQNRPPPPAGPGQHCPAPPGAAAQARRHLFSQERPPQSGRSHGGGKPASSRAALRPGASQGRCL